ncbi:MAG: alpha/beta hydrolase [Zhengella sp.]|uniref:alpha/beta fold hydrolase n=1 Tax=Zhengella sp. TaxID=2282762 RepID=UPI00352776EF|nr:alpha/beta hydrolase [Brucellaceae bacterium]
MTQPTLVLIPGLLCDYASWSTIPGRLAARLPVSMADITRQDSIPAMAQDILDRLSGDLLVAGHSLGGRVAFEMWRLAPERIGGLAVLDTGITTYKQGEEKIRARRVALAHEKGMRALADDWLPPFVHPARHVDLALMGSLAAMVERMTPEIHERQIKALLSRPDAGPVLPTITCPALVATGSHDKWSPPADHEAMAASMADARLVTFEEAGHFTITEQPDSVASEMEGWIDRCLAT